MGGKCRQAQVLPLNPAVCSIAIMSAAGYKDALIAVRIATISGKYPHLINHGIGITWYHASPQSRLRPTLDLTRALIAEQMQLPSAGQIWVKPRVVGWRLFYKFIQILALA